jgi:hypothetical protein
MTKTFAAVALLAVVASPALAATAHRHHPATEATDAMASATDQNGYAQPASGYYMDGPTSTDPDAFIRRSLLIEGEHSTGE